MAAQIKLAVLLFMSALSGVSPAFADDQSKSGITPSMSGGVRPNQRPNIVLIVIDTLRADHLPTYGYAKNTAPFLNKLAGQGIVYTHAFAPCSWTAPSTASLHTSFYPFQHQVVSGFMFQKRLKGANPTLKINRIPVEAETIAEGLRDAGYATFGVSSSINICREQGFDQGFDHFARVPYKTGLEVNALIREWQANIKAAQPYFLYIHYMDPHYPYHKRRPWYRPGANPLEDMIARYDSEIRFNDEKIRALFTLFGWDRDTAVVITSDHGEEFKEHGGLFHDRTLYAEVVNIPLIVYYPVGGITGHQVNNPVSLIDILPTIRSLAGLPPQDNVEGISLYPPESIASDRYRERPLFMHLRKKKGAEPAPDDLLIRALLIDQWKYILTRSEREELFHRDSDPGEQANRFSHFGNRAGEMHSRMLQFYESCYKFKPAYHTDKPMDAEAIKELKSLGYVQ